MEAYPNKMRELVLEADDQGMATKEVAERFMVSQSWVRGVKQRWRERKLRTAIEQKHGPDPKLKPADREQLAQLVQQTPDATLEELKKQLAMPVSITTIWRALVDMKLTLKKSPCMPASRTGQT